MQRYVRFLLLVASATSVATNPAAARPRFGVTAGPQLTQLVSRPYGVIGWPEVKWSPAGLGGLTVEWPLRRGLALATGLEYGGHADDQRWPSAQVFGLPNLNLDTRRQLRSRVMSWPARLEWRPGRWRLGAGPEVRYTARVEQLWHVPIPVAAQPGLAAARGRVAGPAALIFEGVRQGQWQDVTPLFRRWSLAAQLDVGRELPVDRHVLRADLRWSEGVTHQQWAPEATQRTRAAQLALAWLW